MFKRENSIDIVRDGQTGVPPAAPADMGAILKDVWDKAAPAAFGLGLIALVGAFLLTAWALNQATAGLGALFRIEPELSTITAWAVMIGFVGHSIVSAFSPNNSMKFWNGLSAVVWLVIAVALSATYSILRLVGITEKSTFSEMQALLSMGGAVVSPELLTVGRFAYAVLIALALITLTVSVFGAIGMMRRIEDPKHKTLGHVAASAGITIVIVGAAAYSGLHMFTYGTLIGADMFTAATSAVLAEVTFIAALKRAIDTRKGYYVALAGAAIAYALLVNWLEGRAMVAAMGGGSAAIVAFVKTDPLARAASDLYSMAGPAFAMAWGVLEYITSRGQVASTADRGVIVRPPLLSRVASTVASTRQGAGEIRRAWRDPPQLPAPSQVVLAKDAPDSTQHVTLTESVPVLAQAPAEAKSKPPAFEGVEENSKVENLRASLGMPNGVPADARPKGKRRGAI